MTNDGLNYGRRKHYNQHPIFLTLIFFYFSLITTVENTCP